MSIEIQLFSESQVVTHRAEIEELFRLCMTKSFLQEVPNSFYEEKIDALQKYLRNNQGYCFAAVELKKLAGFLWACELASPFGKVFHILYFAVAPEMQAKGIGKLLLNSAEAKARELGVTQMELKASSMNESALKFYDAQKYQVEQLVLTKTLD